MCLLLLEQNISFSQSTKLNNEIFSNIELNNHDLDIVDHLKGNEPLQIKNIFGSSTEVTYDQFVNSRVYYFNENKLNFRDEYFSSLVIKDPTWKLKIGSTTITKDTYFYTLYSISSGVKSYDNKTDTSLKTVLFSPIDNPSGVYISIQISKSTNKIVEIKYGYPS